MDRTTDRLREKTEELGISLNDRQVVRFQAYYALLCQWNASINLTAITSYDEVVVKHYVDSLSIVRGVDMTKEQSMIDIGTGAGFPGIPLKIAFPDLTVALLDARMKRIRFLDEVIRQLNLNQICTIHGRAEDIARQQPYREQFSLCVSRAVAHLRTLAEYCLPYVQIGGHFIAYKSGDIQEELQEAKPAIEALGGELEDVIDFTLPGTDIRRSLVKVRKVKPTDSKYPRKAGTPNKEPL